MLWSLPPVVVEVVDEAGTGAVVAVPVAVVVGVMV